MADAKSSRGDLPSITVFDGIPILWSNVPVEEAPRKTSTS
jgi:hypothetical protein